MGRTWDDGVLLKTLEAGADSCAAAGHRACTPTGTRATRYRCEVLLEQHRDAAELQRRADAFDAGQAVLEQQSLMPDDSWPTAALLRVVHDELLRGPWERVDPHRRGILVGSALARLGERGLPADAVVRSGLGGVLRRRLIGAAALTCGVGLGEADPSDRLPGMETWADALGGCPDIASIDPSEPEAARLTLMVGAMRGDFRVLVDEWLQRASMTHLIAWAPDEVVRPALDEDDAELRGGESAARWICDRFVYTGLEDWSRSSLEWELCFIRDPEQTSRRAGVSLELLLERGVPMDPVTAELASRFARPGTNDELVLGMTRLDARELTVSLVADGRAGAAVDLWRAALKSCPDDEEVRNCLAFALVATSPEEAVEHLARISQEGGVSPLLVLANLAAALVRRGDIEDGLSVLARITSARRAGDEGTFVLWAPRGLARLDQPLTEVGQWEIGAWVSNLSARLMKHPARRRSIKRSAS